MAGLLMSKLERGPGEGCTRGRKQARTGGMGYQEDGGRERR